MGAGAFYASVVAFIPEAAKSWCFKEFLCQLFCVSGSHMSSQSNKIDVYSPMFLPNPER
jgi:hypothetical protein